MLNRIQPIILIILCVTDSKVIVLSIESPNAICKSDL